MSPEVESGLEILRKREEAIAKAGESLRIKPSDFRHGLMGFGKTLEMLKAGCQVAREGWNGKGMFLFLAQGSILISRGKNEIQS